MGVRLVTYFDFFVFGPARFRSGSRYFGSLLRSKFLESRFSAGQLAGKTSGLLRVTWFSPFLDAKPLRRIWQIRSKKY
jgi:hypothetical protein